MRLQKSHFSQPQSHGTPEQTQSDAMLNPAAPPYLRCISPNGFHCFPAAAASSRARLPDHPRRRGRRGCLPCASTPELVVGEHPVLKHDPPPRPPPPTRSSPTCAAPTRPPPAAAAGEATAVPRRGCAGAGGGAGPWLGRARRARQQSGFIATTPPAAMRIGRSPLRGRMLRARRCRRLGFARSWRSPQRRCGSSSSSSRSTRQYRGFGGGF
ncbi:uncharacterized protein LOC133905971 [Phragmites australis]|uniref:uncharacterized protein LOC133905971 n=1 Tax=Phragmites australis TaxID=29695 RepID=UPI002D78ED72|nr:uncharacterized protein LOC133905971 [Phragmites australis]